MNIKRHAEITAKSYDFLDNLGLKRQKDGQFPLLLSKNAFPISKNRLDILQQTGEAVFELLKHYRKMYINNFSNIRNILDNLDNESLAKLTKKLFLHDHTDYPINIFRLDCTFLKEEVKIFEAQFIVGGLGISASLAMLYGLQGKPGHSLLEDYEKIILKHYQAFCKKHQLETHKPVNVIFPYGDNYAPMFEYKVFGKLLPKGSITFNCVHYKDILWGKTPAFYKNNKHNAFQVIHLPHRIDHIHNLLSPKWVKPMYKLYMQNKVLFLESFIERLHDKRIWALYWNKKFQQQIPVSLQKILNYSIPKTYIIDKRNNLINRLIGSTRRERIYFIKKAVSEGSRDVADGYETTSTKWKSLLKNAILQKGKWILQERVPHEKNIVTYISREGQQYTKEMNTLYRITFFVFNNQVKLVDAFANLRNSTKVHGASDSIFIPIEVVDSH